MRESSYEKYKLFTSTYFKKKTSGPGGRDLHRDFFFSYIGIYDRVSVFLTPVTTTDCCPRKAAYQYVVEMNSNTLRCNSHISEARFPHM